MGIRSGREGVRKDQVDSYGRIKVTESLAKELNSKGAGGYYIEKTSVAKNQTVSKIVSSKNDKDDTKVNVTTRYEVLMVDGWSDMVTRWQEDDLFPKLTIYSPIFPDGYIATSSGYYDSRDREFRWSYLFGSLVYIEGDTCTFNYTAQSGGPDKITISVNIEELVVDDDFYNAVQYVINDLGLLEDSN